MIKRKRQRSTTEEGCAKGLFAISHADTDSPSRAKLKSGKKRKPQSQDDDRRQLLINTLEKYKRRRVSPIRSIPERTGLAPARTDYADLKSKAFYNDRGVLPFLEPHLQAKKPQVVHSVLPSFDEKLRQFDPIEDEWIIVALDFQDLCCSKIASNPQGQKEYSYKPIIEAGLAYIDVRDIRRKNNPGDRGQNLQDLIKPIHYIMSEFCGHWETCRMTERKLPACQFAFGESLDIAENSLAQKLSIKFGDICTLSRTPKERGQDELRKVLFVTWDSRLTELTIDRLGLDWFNKPNVDLWDLQKNFPEHGPKLEFVLQPLGLRFVDQFHGSLAGSCGNFTVFIQHALLAIYYMTEATQNVIIRGKPLSFLPYTWQESYLGNRPADLKNDDSVPQADDSKVWPRGRG